MVGKLRVRGDTREIGDRGRKEGIVYETWAWEETAKLELEPHK